MIFKNQKWDNLLELFFEHPDQTLTIREITKRTRIPHSTVQRYLQDLRKKEIITKENKANINPYFKFIKTFFIIRRMFEIGLIKYLEETLNPSIIIVFGSARKGEYYYESDIDIFIESTKSVKINISSFEKKIKHKIQLFIYKNINDLPPNLFNNVVNGIKLRGYYKIR